MLRQLEATVEALKEEHKTLETQRSRIRRIFGRGGTEEEIAQTAADLADEVDAPMIQDLAKRANDAIAASKIPPHFDALVQESPVVMPTTSRCWSRRSSRSVAPATW